MRRAASAATVALLALLASAPAAGHPGHGAEAVTVAGDVFAYEPATLTVGVGDSVIWFWEGSLFRNHSVTADPGQDEAFDSDPNGLPDNSTHPPGQGFVHTFSHVGTFTYHCKVHPQMRGTVDVLPLTLTGRPPRLSRLRIDGAVAKFELSRQADVVARIARLKNGRARVVETFSKRARAGANRVRLPLGDLGPGRYELRLVAYDSSDRRSNEATERFKIRR